MLHWYEGAFDTESSEQWNSQIASYQMQRVWKGNGYHKRSRIWRSLDLSMWKKIVSR
jgi:hypothetical protein